MDFKLLSLNAEDSICIRLLHLMEVRIKIIGLKRNVRGKRCFQPTPLFVMDISA